MSKALKKKCLEKSTCYYCGEDIHNYELSELVDGRIIKSCFECYNTIEIGKIIYYCRLAEIDIPWGLDDV